MKTISIFVMFMMAFLVGCPPTPQPPVVDSGDGGKLGDAGATCENVCQHLRDIGCADGWGVDGGASCEATCTHVQSAHLTDMHLVCLLSAKDKGAAISCGSVVCR